MDENLQLHVLDGDYGLISLDIDCVHSILYAKLCNIPVNIELVNSIKTCAFHKFPSLKSANLSLDNANDIMVHLRKLSNEIDESLTPKQLSESLALANLMSMSLRPIIDFLYWLDARNYQEFTSPWFMKALVFPFNLSYVKRKRKNAMDFIETLYPFDSDMEVVKEFISKSATQCFSSLSARLGKASYFHGGDAPTSIDVQFYAYVAAIVKLPFPSTEISNLLAMWPNLIELVKRIDAKYLPDVSKETKYLREDKAKQNDDDVSYVAICIIVVSATTLALAFARKSGALSMPW